MNKCNMLAKTLGEISRIATALQGDILPLEKRTAKEVDRYRSGSIKLEELCFWHKSLIRAFLSCADGLSYALREHTVRFADALEVDFPRKRWQELSNLDRRMPLEKSLKLAFRSFPRLFGLDFTLDTSGEDYRAFIRLLEAREDFAHPKNYRDLCPFEIFPTFKPAMEWVLANWKLLLVSCASALGLPLADQRPVERSSRFHDGALVRWEEARRTFESGRREGDFIEELQDILFTLMKETGQAVDLLSNSLTPGYEIPLDCAVRNLVATVFSEIEGSVFLAASQLSRFAGYSTPTEELLIGDHREVRERIIYTLEQFSRRFGTGVVIRRNGPGWENFVVARAMRNRFTHPKHPEDLMIRSGELDPLMELLSWWHGEMHQCFELAGGKLP